MMTISVPFDPSWENISVAVSGGADSALLAYILCSQIENTTVHIINNIRCWKTKPWQQDNVATVIEWLRNRFSNITFKVHTNFVPPELEWGDKGRTIIDEYGKLVSGDTLELRAYAEYVLFHTKSNAYYNGVTRNPKDVDFQGMSTRDIDPNDSNKHLEAMTVMGKNIYHPFRFIDKSVILKKYRLLDIMDLFELTRSCEGVFDIDYTTYKPGQDVPLCNNCFWCKERSWAIEQSK